MIALETVPVDRINARARQAKPGRTALAVIAFLLFGAGWLIAKAFGLLWLAIVWCAAAVIEGWIAARKGNARGPGRSG